MAKPCKHCGQNSHWPFQCRYNPKKRKRINKYGKVAQRMTDFRKYWIKRHGGEKATWICYLQIHPLCPRTLTVETLTLEHVVAKSTDPSQRFEVKNIKPACAPCNGMKGSRKLDKVKEGL